MKILQTLGTTLANVVIFNVILTVLSGTALAFNPPVETTGPLTVKIEGPELVTETEKPQAVRVVLTNKGKQSLSGKLQLAVIDHWWTDPEAESDFSVPRT